MYICISVCVRIYVCIKILYLNPLSTQDAFTHDKCKPYVNSWETIDCTAKGDINEDRGIIQSLSN